MSKRRREVLSETSWQVRVTGGEDGAATVLARKSRFPVGPPLSFDPECPWPTAVEHLLGAVGADLVNGLKLAARRRRLRFDQVEALVDCRLDNPLSYLEVVGEEGHPGVRHLAARVFLSTLDPQDQVQQAWDEALRRSPLLNTLRPAVELDVSYRVVL